MELNNMTRAQLRDREARVTRAIRSLKGETGFESTVAEMAKELEEILYRISEMKEEPVQPVRKANPWKIAVVTALAVTHPVGLALSFGAWCALRTVAKDAKGAKDPDKS